MGEKFWTIDLYQVEVKISISDVISDFSAPLAAKIEIPPSWTIEKMYIICEKSMLYKQICL